MPHTHSSPLPTAREAFRHLLENDEFAGALRRAGTIIAGGNAALFGAYRTTHNPDNVESHIMTPRVPISQGVGAILRYCSLGRPLIGVFAGRPGQAETPITPNPTELSYLPDIVGNRPLGILGIVTLADPGLTVSAIMRSPHSTVTPQKRQQQTQRRVASIESVQPADALQRHTLITEAGFRLVDFSFDGEGTLAQDPDPGIAALFRPQDAQTAP